MSDTTPTGRDLDRAIAERLGWRTQFLRQSGYEWYADAWALINPSEDYATPETGAKSENEAWAYIPHYHSDANATLAELMRRNLAPTVCSFDGAFAASVEDDGPIMVHGETPAHALALLLLAVLEARTDDR